MPRRTEFDLAGKRFGKLLVLSESRRHGGPNGNNYLKLLCRCDCGTEKFIAVKSLKGGVSKSCGCSWTEKVEKMVAARAAKRVEKRRADSV